jgi:pimeloyl-ACP methyl ester carboxylesterase
MTTPFTRTSYRTVTVDGLNIFYREAGSPDKQTIVLLHGFPTSSHMFRELIPALAADYHVIAPDYPGFGYSDSPTVDAFDYTFDNLAHIVGKLLEAKRRTRYWLYMQDYGGPVGLRLATAHPDRVAGLFVQNANAYMEGVSEMLASAAMPFWQGRNAATEAPLRGLVTLDGVKMQYITGVKDPSRISPDAWTHDLVSLGRPGNAEAQLALLFNYQSNVPRFAEWQAYFREHQPPTLITWGKGDPFFTEAGAWAYLKDLPKAELHLLDTGHFALEEDGDVIADFILNFLGRNLTLPTHHQPAPGQSPSVHNKEGQL